MLSLYSSFKCYIMSILKNMPLALLSLLCVSFIPFHHGWGNYDQEKVLDYKGTVVEVVYENPHVTTKVKDKTKTWSVFLAPISRMNDRGIAEGMLKKGMSVRIVGYPHKKIEDEMRAERIFIAGEKYELR